MRCSACGGFKRRVMVERHAPWCPYVSPALWHVFQHRPSGAGTMLVWATPRSEPVTPTR